MDTQLIDTPRSDSIILIGMPGAGKSTVGMQLAQRLQRDFIDTDHLIERSENKSLQEIVDSEGYEYLRRVEQRELLTIEGGNKIIATGGSAIYSEKAIQHLQRLGILVYLAIEASTMQQRLQSADPNRRGLAKPKEQTLVAMFNEREAMYCASAGHTVICGGRSTAEICDEIIGSLVLT